MGGVVIEEGLLIKKVIYVFVMIFEVFVGKFQKEFLFCFKGVKFFFFFKCLIFYVWKRVQVKKERVFKKKKKLQCFLCYQWLEDSLILGEKVNEDLYFFKFEEFYKKFLFVRSGSED